MKDAIPCSWIPGDLPAASARECVPLSGDPSSHRGDPEGIDSRPLLRDLRPGESRVVAGRDGREWATARSELEGLPPKVTTPESGR